MSGSTDASQRAPDGATKGHLRGSAVMLAGRMIALVLNLVTQVVIVRALTKGDFGSFAYALSLLTLASTFARLGMDRAMARFVPIYYERGDLPRAAGVIRFIFASTLICGALMAGGLLLLSRLVLDDSVSASLLLVLCMLAPIEAWESGLLKLLAIFARPRDLMFRRHVAGPLLKLAAAVPVLLLQADVLVLAWCYVGARLAGTGLSYWLTRRELRRAGVLGAMKGSPLQAREVLAFSLPLLSSDGAQAIRTTVVTLLIEFFHGVVILAAYRAVVPLSRLNAVVSDSFQLLYNPALARLYARQDRDQMTQLYWFNAVWIALLTFPVFLATCLFAEPLTTLMFGDRYRDASQVLAVLAVASYLNACFGFNQITLQVLGRVRMVVVNDVLGTAAAFGLMMILIPRYGAIGGAMAVMLAQIVQNGLNQWALAREGTIRGMDAKCLLVYGYLLAATAAVAGTVYFRAPLAVSVAVAAVVSLTALRLSWQVLDAADVFPELQKVPGLRRLISRPAAAGSSETAGGEAN